MTDFESALLNRLLDKYEASVLSRQGSTRRLRIRLDSRDEALKSYRGVDAARYAEENDAVLNDLEKAGIITVERNRNGMFESLTFNTDHARDVYARTGRKKRNEILRQCLEILSAWPAQSEPVRTFIKEESSYIAERYSMHKAYYSSPEELKDVLTSVEAILKLDEEMMERDFSVSVLHDSKRFAAIQNKAVNVLKKYTDVPEDTEDVLAYFNIVKNSTYALIRQNVTFRINHQTICLNDLGYEFSLSDAMIFDLVFMDTTARKVITVENLTSFYKLGEPDAIIIYLAGYHNHTRQELCRKLYASFPELEYLHFGDIDAGGFSIYHNLCRKTGIDFRPYRMGVEELEQHKDSSRPLTVNDRKRLTAMLDKDEYAMFHDVIAYMLEHDVKLEQEILDGS